MKYLYCLLLLLTVSSCASSFVPSAQAPRSARHTYRHAQRHNARVRAHCKPSYLPWN